MELGGPFAMAMVAAVVAVFFGLVVSSLWKAVKAVCWEPWSIRRAFVKQGVTCLPAHLLLGNLREISRMLEAARSSPLPLVPHNVAPRILPYYYHYKKTCGALFVFWLGYRAALVIINPEHIKEILSNKFGHFRKIAIRPEARDFIGESVATLEGERWAQHRRIVSPAFFVEKLKGMTPTMVACISAMLDKWQNQVDGHDSKEIDAHEQFKVLTADIIAHTAFGSSYEEGKQVFKLQNEQQVLLADLGRSIYIPGFRFLPTSRNRYSRRLNNGIQATLRRIIASRGDNYTGDDLLGILMAANRNELLGTQKNLSLSMQEIVDECKTFFFAGHETTATLLTWTTMLLAINPEWQERTREEVLEVCGKLSSPTYETLHSLKLVGMVLNETLRLYPPAAVMIKETAKEMTLGSICVPPNTMIFIPVIDLHHDQALWGADAQDFNPQRFADGVATASTTPLAFFPFSMGPRHCVGQNFALLEARAILALMLQRFRFSLSPSYKHSPITRITLQPQHGMQIVLEKL